MPLPFGMNRPSTRLILLGFVSAVLYGFISWSSFRFSSDVAFTDRPLLAVLTLFGAAFLLYLLACCEVWPNWKASENNQKTTNENGSGRTLLRLIVGFGILFRCILLFSVPIQEIDLYRYIVDGAVGNANVSPYEFAPAELVRATDALAVDTNAPGASSDGVLFARSSDEQERLARLASLIVSKPGLNDCLHQVHYGNYTSPYPPISQAVFRIAASMVPDNASHYVWMFAMKVALTALDILTGFMLIGLLRHCRLPDRISLCYWWCPLVMKEIANSGHLDSIAICLTVGFSWMAVAAIWPMASLQPDSSAANVFSLSSGAAVLLGLAVGAKIYPLVLAPVWAICLLRHKGAMGLIPVLVFAGVSVACTWPIVRTTSMARDLKLVPFDAQADEVLVVERRMEAGASKARVLRRPDAGIEMFSRYWEMNDLIFMFVVENVRPNQPTDGSEPWFLVTTESQRSRFARSVIQGFGLERNEFAFSFTRIVTLGIYVLLTVAFCFFAWRATSASDLLQLFFMSVAWFWLLSPTQNPWYWLWALPFLPFLKRPVPWLVLNGTLFLYYLRFHFQNHYPNENVGSTQYNGQLFFDFVIPWVEFLPVFAMLLGGAIVAGWRRRES